MSWVECDALERALRDDLLALPGCGQMHKDIQQGRNKAPNTLARMIAGAVHTKQVSRIVGTISGFIAARNPRSRRKLPELIPLETKLDGEMDCTEMAIAQGDMSTPTLMKLKEQIASYRELLDDMGQALDSNLYGVPGR